MPKRKRNFAAEAALFQQFAIATGYQDPALIEAPRVSALVGVPADCLQDLEGDDLLVPVNSTRQKNAKRKYMLWDVVVLIHNYDKMKLVGAISVAFSIKRAASQKRKREPNSDPPPPPPPGP